MRKIVALGILVLLMASSTAWAASILATASVACDVNGTQQMVKNGYECKAMGGNVVLPSAGR